MLPHRTNHNTTPPNATNNNSTANTTPTHHVVAPSQYLPSHITTLPTNPFPKNMVLIARSPSPLEKDFDPLTFDLDLTPLPKYKDAAEAALDFGGLLAAPLKVHEDPTSGCGGQTWIAGLTLTRHLLRYHRADLQDARM